MSADRAALVGAARLVLAARTDPATAVLLPSVAHLTVGDVLEALTMGLDWSEYGDVLLALSPLDAPGPYDGDWSARTLDTLVGSHPLATLSAA